MLPALPRSAAPVAAVLSLLPAAVPAAGHSDLTGVAPRDGAVLDGAPPRVVITYGEALGGVQSARVTVAGDVVSGRATLDSKDARRLVVPLTTRGPGAHRVEWTVIAADGDALSGHSGFTVRLDPVTRAVRLVGALTTRAGRALEASVTA